MLNKKITLRGVGDNLLVRKDPEAMFALGAPVLEIRQRGNWTIGDTMYGKACYCPTIGEAWGVKPPHACEPKRLDTFTLCRFQCNSPGW